MRFKNLIFFKALVISGFLILQFPAISQVIIDHNCTDITKIPESVINQTKSQLHIGYGHTSHGSQLTDGMSGLVEFANNGGKGLSHSNDTFAWNNGGSGGALDLHDYAMGGDVGYYPQWVNNTRSYLGTVNSEGRGSDNPDINVIMWSWCGQVDSKYTAGTLDSEYLTPMSQLEAEYYGVTFIYMTGHVDHWDDANNKAANQVIRNYCNTNGKVLYDFADIESYDPEGTYYEFPHDNCDYYASADGEMLGNWAIEWQNYHTQGVDWYNCGAAHTQPLNSNQKAYAAWWLWAVLAGWDEITDVQDDHTFIPLTNFKIEQNFPNPFNSVTSISYFLPEMAKVDIVIYNLKGERICKLVDRVQQPGTYSIIWKGKDDKERKVSSGIYLYIFKVNNRRIVKKMTLLE